jgi:putative membrane protein
MSTSLRQREPTVLLAAVLAVLALSAINPTDRYTWWLEVAPVLIVISLLLWTCRTFPLTSLLYRLIFLHAVILIVGGYYTYAEVPAGFWVRDWLGLERNNYDRLGHLAQGFIPAILAREILLRKTPLQRGGWLFYLVLCICLSFSACFEMFEWLIAVVAADGATAYLGSQGDVWDAQWDMLCALIGATAALLTLAKLHDRQLEIVRSGNR